MKKIMNLFLSVLVALVGVPLKAMAETLTAATPPIFVTPLSLNKEVDQLKKDVLDKERMNRNDEMSAMMLAQENAALVEKLKKYQSDSTGEFAERVPGDLYASIQTLNELTRALENYSRQLDERNREMMAVNNQNVELKERVAKAEAFYNEALKHNNDLEASKASALKDQDTLVASLQKERDSLLEKNKVLVDQQKQLQDFQTQLANTKKDLLEANQRYQDLQKINSTKVETLKPEVVEPNINVDSSGLLSELNKTKGALRASDIRYKDLEEQDKNKDIAIEKLKKESEALNKIMATLKSSAVNIQKSEQGLQEKDASLAKLQKEVLNKDAEIVDLKMKLAQTIKELTEVKEQLADKDKTLNAQQVSINSLGLEMGTVKSSFSEMQNKYENYDQGFKQIREKIVNLKDQLAKAQERAALVETREQELIKAKGELAALTYQLQNAQDDSKSRQAEVQKLKLTVEEQSKQLEVSKKDVQDQNQKVHDLTNKAKEERDVYQGMIKKVQGHVKDLAVQVGSLKTGILGLIQARERAELYKVIVSKYNTFESLSIEKSSLLLQLVQKRQDRAEYYRDQLKKTIVYWQDLNQGTEQKIEALEQEAKDKQKEIDTMQGQLQENQQKVSQLNDMLDVYQKKAETKEADNKTREEQVNSLSKDLMTAQTSLAERESDLKKVKDFFFELEQKYSAKVKELRERGQEVALLKQGLEQKTLNATQLQEKVTSLQEKYLTAQKIADIQASHAVSAMEEKKKKEAELKTLTAAQEKLLVKQQSKDNSVNLQFLKASSDEAAQLKIALQEKENQIDQLKKAAQGNLELQRKLDDAKAKITKLMEDVYFKDKEIQRVKLQESSKDTTIKAVDQKAVVVDKENPAAVTVKKEMTTNKDYDRMEDLRVQIKEARSETEDARAAARDKNKQVQQLTAEIKELNKKIQTLEGRVKDL